MTEIQSGPYWSMTAALAVAHTFTAMGENVRIIESFEPYQRKGKQYSAYVIREVSA
jgi:hypothetical protein